MTDENKVKDPEMEEMETEDVEKTSETELPEDPAEEDAAGENNDEETAAAPENPDTEELKRVKDQLLRTLAEFDNYRKRTTREKEQTFERGERYVIEAFLPVIDNLERAIAAHKDPEDPLFKGIQMTYDQMIQALSKLGVTQLDDMGKTFDPHFHDAMQHVDDEAYGESEIVAVFRKGYVMNETVIRPSLVKVAN